MDPQLGMDDVRRLVERAGVDLRTDDVLLLPELIGRELDHDAYVGMIAELATDLGTWVVGGSHHHERDGASVNCGTVVGPNGAVAAEFEKANPYGFEDGLGVVAGGGGCTVRIGERTVAVVICADFWFAEHLLGLEPAPEVILVPALSVTQWPSPHPARTIWRHMSVARAYEFAAFVAISDWAPSAETYDGRRSAGVAGFASPCAETPRSFFQGMGGRQVVAFTPDFDRLDALRQNRRERGFLREVSDVGSRPPAPVPR